MADDIAVLEKQLDEFELLLTGGLRLSDKRLVDRVELLRNQLKSRCLKGELSVELVKNPIEKLVALLNVVNNPNDLQLGEKIRTINAQAGLIGRRLELLKDIERLKTAFNAEDLKNAVQLEGKLDELLAEFSELNKKIGKLIADSHKEQQELDSLFDAIEQRLTALES
ncbi:hypothetical protein M3Y97_00394000 [Aphelenchoides bicaudatus]|nr:hypothetical protein M3Y97_00394000 [Aphelenchoides bicaudatus]